MLLKLTRELTVARAREVRDLLLDAIAANGEVELDAEEVAEVDVAGLQLLCAAHRSAHAAGKTLCFAGGSPGERIEKGMRAAGLGRLDGRVSTDGSKEESHG